MKKKTLIPLVLSFALIFWATPMVFGGMFQADQVPASDRRGPRVPAIPLEKGFCVIQNDDGSILYYWSGFGAGDGVAAYMDPAVCPDPPPYPFRVTDAHFYLYDDGAMVWPVQIDVNVRDLVAGDSCNGPGNKLCSETFTIPYDSSYNSLGRPMNLTISPLCCVNGPFFLEIVYTGGTSSPYPSPLFSDETTSPADTCNNWLLYGGLYYEWYDAWTPPVPGNIILRATGNTHDPDCPGEYKYLHAEDGLFQSLNFHLENLHLHSLQGILEPGIPPESTIWHELYPHYCRVYHLGYWEDNGDGELSPCDMIEIEQIEPPGEIHMYHVKEVTLTLVLTDADDPMDTMYLEFTGGYDLSILYQPICTWWHEVWPNFCNWFHLSSWSDNGNGYLDSCDYVDITDPAGNVTWWHVEDVATDILLKRESFDPLGSQWHQVWPYYCERYQLTSWEDNGDGILSPSDQIDMTLKDADGNPTGPISWYHIDEVTTTIFVVEKTQGGGQGFSCDDAADANDDGILTIADCDYITAFLFHGGPPPPPPYPNCGPDPTPDGLGCASFPPCPPGEFVRGDANEDGVINVADVATCINGVQPGLSGRTMILEYLGMSDSLITEPESTMWHEKYPVYCSTYHLLSWEDDGDGFLSISDEIHLMNEETGIEGYYHVYEICRDLWLTRKPYETQWHELYPEYCNWYHVEDWVDNTNGLLDSCDTLVLRNKETDEVDTVHVVNKTVTLILESPETYDTMAVEWIYEGVEDPRIFLANPVCNNLHEIWPVFSRMYHLSSWIDNGDGFLSYCDTIDITDLETEEVTWWHVIDVATDITVEIPPCFPPNIGCPADESQNQNGVYTTTTQWVANDGNPGDLSVELISVAVQPPLPPGISAANVNFLGPVPGPGLGVKATWGTVTYTVSDHCQADGAITLIATNNCPPPNTATCSFNVALTNDPPDITQPDSLEGLVDDVVEYDITGNDPNGDVIMDQASITIEPDCGTYSITRTVGHGTSSGTWHVTWNTDGCTACITHLVIHDLTDTCGATSYCTTKVHLTTEGWPNHKMHFPQLPDLEGWDVYAVLPKTLADDWQCSRAGPVLDIHFWGSWKDLDGDPYTDDFLTPMPLFQLSIHRNIPATPDTPWSRPGELVWWWEGEIPGTPFEPPAMEHWFNPNTGEVFYNDHVPYWRYDFFFDQAEPPPAPFFQYKDTIYWLNVSAVGIPEPYEWGWKSSRDHFMDDATYTDNPPDGPWFPLYEPPRANWFDVMFGPDGVPEDLGSTNYYGQGWYQYEYWWNMWFYNNPFVYQPKHIWLEFYVDLPYPHSYAEFAINWSTDLWSLEGEPGRPPLPGEDETLYIGREIFTVVDGWNTIDYWIDDYNPEWVSIDFVAVDAMINGWIWHECVQTSMDLAFVITGEIPPDTVQNHYKTWLIVPEPFDTTVFVQDQFMEEDLDLVEITFISNPVKKVVENDTFDIISPNDHLTWYRTFGRDTLIQVGYVNQFESTTVVIDVVEFLLVPTQKEPHAPPESLDHYKAYHIQDGVEFPVMLSLEDQFDIEYGEPEYIEFLRPIYFLTPSIKNMEQPEMFDSITHYVAYEIFPERAISLTRNTLDQFGSHDLLVLSSEMLLVPSKKWIPPPCDPPTIGCPADESQNQNGVYTTTTQWTADDGNPADPNVWLTSVAVQPPLPPGISAANVNFTGCVPGPGCKSTNGTVTYTVSDHCQAGGPITLIATNNCPPPNNTATCSFNVTLTNDPPDITQPDSLEGLINDVVEYDITGNDPNGDIIHDQASITIEPDCGTYSITRTSGSGTSSGTWHITWNTNGCTACITHLVIHDLTDTCGATSYCTTKVHLSEEVGWYWKPEHEDYAPSGMPDIDQKQDRWIKTDLLPDTVWTFCGPVAVANCFKWFDSKYNQVNPGVPGDGMDQFPLVRDYLDNLVPFIPPATDDHDPWNVNHVQTPWTAACPPPPTPQPFRPGAQPQPSGMPAWGELVERLACFFNTDGSRTEYCSHRGTNILQMQEGIQMWFDAETLVVNGDTSLLSDSLCEVTTRKPSFAYVESLVEKCEDVILLLGFWFQENPQEFIRGDLDQDGAVNVADLVLLLHGPPYFCDDAADIDDDGTLDRDSDSTYFWNYIFVGGPPPPPPFPDCGPDLTPDGLFCAEFPGCPPPSGEWRRIGGHYVTVAGVNSERFKIAFSDPFIDNAEMGGPGRVRDGFYIPHPHGVHDPTVHNDEGNVSHDIYTVVPESPSPGGLWALGDYPVQDEFFPAESFFDIFYAQNMPDEFLDSTQEWNGASQIFTEVEYCVHISPWDYRGDCNGDGIINSADVVCLIDYLFKGGPAPDPLSEVDVTCDGIVNSADVVFLIDYLFKGGPVPRCCDP